MGDGLRGLYEHADINFQKLNRTEVIYSVSSGTRNLNPISHRRRERSRHSSVDMPQHSTRGGATAGRINEVARRWARLVPGRVTDVSSGGENQLGM